MRKAETKFFAMKIDPETRRKLEVLARATERTASGYVRWLIQREYKDQESELEIEKSAPTAG